jgi:hypothetical protein
MSSPALVLLISSIADSCGADPSPLMATPCAKANCHETSISTRALKRIDILNIIIWYFFV